MDTIKTIWQKSYLGRLFKTDLFFARGLSFVLAFYVVIHVFRLEMYPMYMFAMFSKQESPRELYYVYNIYEGDDKVNLTDLNFREYTVLMNTIGQYDGIIGNNMKHPEAEAIDKFVNRLNLKNSSIEKKLHSSFVFSKSELEIHLGAWLSDALTLDSDQIRIEKASYTWKERQPEFIDTQIIYGHD